MRALLKTRRGFVGTVKNRTPVYSVNHNALWLLISGSGVRASLDPPFKTPTNQALYAKTASIPTALTASDDCAGLCGILRKTLPVVRRAFVGRYDDICAEFLSGPRAPGTPNSQADPAKRQIFSSSEPPTQCRRWEAPSMSRFDYVRYDQEAAEAQGHFKDQFEKLESFALSQLKPGRALDHVMDALEVAYMWVGKAIRDDQIARAGSAEPQEGRNTS